MKNISKRVQEVDFAGNRVIFEKAKELERAGRDIIHMEIGRPDFDTPKPVKQAAVDALNAGKVHYTSNYGLDELRDEIVTKLKEDNEITVNRKQIIITPGAMMALTTAIMGLIDPGDEVLIPAPYYPSFYKQVQLAGGKPVAVPLSIDNGYQLTEADLAQYYSYKTKLIILNSPNNPTGAVLKKSSMEEIASFTQEHDLFVLSDECYEKFLYEGEHISIASLPGMAERTFTVNSTSKTYSMTGWRIGFLACPEGFSEELVKLPQNMTICPTTFAQHGSIKAYKLPDSILQERLEIFQERRDIVVEHLSQLENVDFLVPAGGLYAFPRFNMIANSALEFCDYLLEGSGIAVVPGLDFGPDCEKSVRIAFTCSTDEVKEGMARLVEAVKKL